MQTKHRSIAAAVVASAVVAGFGTTSVAGAATTFTAKLSGQTEDPPSEATGSARLTVRPSKGQICFRIKLEGAGRVLQGHIHKGGKNVAGPVFVALFDQPTRQPRGCADATRAQIRAIMRKPGGYYVNVHNAEYPAGVARGQLRK